MTGRRTEHAARQHLREKLEARARQLITENYGMDPDEIGKSLPGLPPNLTWELTWDIVDLLYRELQKPEFQAGIQHLLYLGIRHLITDHFEEEFEEEEEGETVLAVAEELRDRGFRVTSIHASLRLAVAAGLTRARAQELARTYPPNPNYGCSASYLLKVAVAELTGGNR